MTVTTSLADIARRDLTDLDGRIVGPDDPGYDEARAVHNGMIDRHPAVIARCASADEVARCIAFARAHDTAIAVRSGGHNGGGLGIVDDGLVIDLAGMTDVVVDSESDRVRVGGGCTWGQVDQATAEHGRATPSGIISTTGVGGLTLGGGLGHLTRRFGLTVDSLVSADVVLADGSQVRASADEHPDLFWALRGGGGNFGIVTSFEFRTHPIGATLMAGPTFWPIEQTPEVMRFYREFLPAAPRAVNDPALLGPCQPVQRLRLDMTYTCPSICPLRTLRLNCYSTASDGRYPTATLHLMTRMLGLAHVGAQRLGERVTARHAVLLAAFRMQPDRPASAAGPEILDLHLRGRIDADEAVSEGGDQCQIAQIA